VRIPPAYFGLHDGSMQAYDTLSYGSLRLWDAGVTWPDIEVAPGVYDWTRLDTLVAAAQAHHVQVTLVLAMTPAFYGPAPSLPPTHLSAYRDFVRAVMSRYKDFDGSRGIAAYQVWNEGNVPTFWTGTPAQLAQLTRIVWQARQQVDPGATVVAPSFAVRLVGQRRWLSDYMTQRVSSRPVWRFFDASAVSLYPKARYGDRMGGPEDAMALLARARHRLALAGVPAGRPVWATEINYGVNSQPSSATPISEQRQVANVMRTYLLGAAHGLARLFWYRYDWNTVPSLGGGTLGNTLLTTPGQWDQITAAGRALDTVQQWLAGRLVHAPGHRPCAKDAHGTYTCVVTFSGGTRTIMWNPSRKVTVDVRGATYAQSGSGARTELGRGGASVPVGFQPVMVVTPR
jgi:polysaccharide biosynthesis protein PslG